MKTSSPLSLTTLTIYDLDNNMFTYNT